MRSCVPGIVGLGQMGSAIAERLLGDGADLRVFDVNATAVAKLEKAGATACASVRELADSASLVLTCLPGPAISLAVAREAALAERVEILAELSTIGRDSIHEMNGILAAAGIELVDAPVSGGPLGARQGTLNLMLAGSSVASERVALICGPACGNVAHVGVEPGQAQLAKLVNNGISMTAFLVSSEVVAAAVGAGFPPEAVVAHLNDGRARNSGTLTKLPKYVLDRTFDVGATLESALKDQDLYLDEYRKAGLPEGVVAGTRELWAKTVQMLDPEGDAATIIRYFEHFTGTEVATGTRQEGKDRSGDAGWLGLADSAIAYTVLAAICEAAAVGLRGGIAPRTLLNVLNAGTARSYWTERVFNEQVLTRRFDTGTSIDEACNALRRYLKVAAKAGLPAGLVSRALYVLDDARTQIGADADVTAMIKRYERIVGTAFADVA